MIRWPAGALRGSDWLLVQAGALRRSEPPEIAEKSDIFIRVGHDVDLWRPKQGGLSRVLYRLWDFLAVTLHQESIRPRQNGSRQ